MILNVNFITVIFVLLFLQA